MGGLAGIDAPLPLGEDPSVEPEGWIGTRYRVLRLLGRGGTGEVYEVDDAELGTRVALKVVRGRPWDAEAVAQLEREIQIARRITHPNVCRLYDFGMHLFRGAIAGDPRARVPENICRVQIISGDQWPALEPGEGVTLDDVVFTTPSPDIDW